MRDTTKAIIRAARDGDSSSGAEERREWARALAEGIREVAAEAARKAEEAARKAAEAARNEARPVPAEYVTRSEIARRLGVCKDYVGELVRKGVIVRAPGANGHRMRRYALRPAQ